MADLEADLGGAEIQLAGLEGTLGGLETVAQSFRRELEGVGVGFRSAGRDAGSMSRTLSSSLRRAFDGVVFDGKRVSDALIDVGRSVSGSALNQALAPVQKAFGSALGGVQALVQNLMPFGSGGVIDHDPVARFARGGVVERPTAFPMHGGAGLMGETGPEAIMPLARGPDGRLGIRAGSSPAAVHVT